MTNFEYCFKNLQIEFNFCGVLNLEPEDIILQQTEFASARYIASEKKYLINYRNEHDIWRLIYESFNYNLKSDFQIFINHNFNDLAIMVDVARNNVLTVQSFKRLIHHIALLGYSTLKIYLEDVFEIDGEPYFGHFRGRYKKEELSEIVAYAKLFNLNVVPCIQTLAHLKTLKRWCVYRPYFDIDDILMVGETKVYELIDKMMKTVKEIFNSDVINIGMDEAHNLGRGAYLDKNGYRKRIDILKEHLAKVLKIAQKYNFCVEMWSDMFFNNLYSIDQDSSVYEGSEVEKSLKIIYWDYSYRPVEEYKKNIALHKTLTENVTIASGSWKWLGFIPNNHYAIKHNKNMFIAAKDMGIKEYTLTCWGDNGGETSIFAILPVINYVANLNYISEDVKESYQFKKLTNIDYEDFIKIDLVNNTKNGLTIDILNSSNRDYLYNDIMLGIFDSCIKEDQVKTYETVIESLQNVGKNSKFDYIFDTSRSLALVLKRKVKIALGLRNAYQNKDFKALKLIISDLMKLKMEVEDFYQTFYKQWHKESKGCGFEVQDIRIGALKQRIDSTIRRLEDYLEGNIKDIDELDEIALDFYGNNQDFYKPDDLVDPYWVRMSSVNVND